MKWFIAIVVGFFFLNAACNTADQKTDQQQPQSVPTDELTKDMNAPAPMQMKTDGMLDAEFNTEDYAHIDENAYRDVLAEPVSTFSIDVDAASYANVRRFINQNQLPPVDAVRIEELINYFTYDYPQPAGEHPFSVSTEVTQCPWNADHSLVLIGLKGKEVQMQSLPANNLVFLLDVSGSMESPEKLPLLKSAFKLLVNEMRPQDKVSIVVYAGAAGVVLPPTSGEQKTKIIDAVEQLSAGGSTAGGEGILLAYKLAKENFIADGNNRIILATDGDFNVGMSSDSEMERLVEEKRKEGIYLTVLGFGMGNYKDNKMELLADKGNGNYAYIDNILEAKKVLVSEAGGTLLTIAKDVKIQIEFNPAHVKSYRLIGYENRLLNREDFNNDKKDAGEMGAGHEVTALYEIIPAGSKENTSSVDSLKYQNTNINPEAFNTNEMMAVKLRYKKPDSETSILMTTNIMKDVKPFVEASNNAAFAATVASFGMLLRNSEYKGTATFVSVLKMAKEHKGADVEGYRSEFITLIEKASLLKGN